MIRGFDPSVPGITASIAASLERYAQIIEPWATAVANRMISEVAARDRKQWMMVSAQMGRALHKEIETAPTGALLRQRLSEQVSLIKSIPEDAAKQVHELTIGAAVEGKRPDDLVDEIMRIGGVTRSRATLIARTEVARTATELTRARAEHVGSKQFIWRTMKDENVRKSHRRLEGKVFSWDDPPECDPGYHALPGGIFNCRCYPEPILTEADNEDA